MTLTDTKDDLIERLEFGLRTYAASLRGHHSMRLDVAKELDRLADEAARALRASAGREMVTDAMVDAAVHAYNQAGNYRSSIGHEFMREALRAALSTPDGWQSMETAKPVAWRVHDFHIVRQPVKARGHYPEPTEYLYPAEREEDAKAMAKIVNGTCSALYQKDADQ